MATAFERQGIVNLPGDPNPNPNGPRGSNSSSLQVLSAGEEIPSHDSPPPYHPSSSSTLSHSLMHAPPHPPPYAEEDPINERRPLIIAEETLRKWRKKVAGKLFIFYFSLFLLFLVFLIASIVLGSKSKDSAHIFDLISFSSILTTALVGFIRQAWQYRKRSTGIGSPPII